GPGPSFQLRRRVDDLGGCEPVAAPRLEEGAQAAEELDRGRVVGGVCRAREDPRGSPGTLGPVAAGGVRNGNQRAPVVGGAVVELGRYVRVSVGQDGGL